MALGVGVNGPFRAGLFAPIEYPGRCPGLKEPAFQAGRS